MNIYGLTFVDLFPLMSLVFIMFLGMLVLSRSGKSPLSRLFFAMVVIIALWEIGTFMMFMSSNDQQIDFWDRFIYLGVVFFPAIQYQFSLEATFYNKRRKLILAFAYLLSICFLVLSRTTYFVSGVFHYYWGAHTRAQLGHHFFIAFFFIFALAFVYNFAKGLRKINDKTERSRALYYIVAFLFLNVVAGLGYLPAYGIPVYPISLIAPLVFSVLITYAIIFYGLMDIKIMVRSYLVYFFSLLSVVVPAAGLIYLFSFAPPLYSYLAYLLFLVFALLLFPALRKYFYKIANKHLFSSLYDVRELVYDLNIGLHSSLNVDHVLNSIIGILNQAFHSEAITMISYNSQVSRWEVLHNHGFDFEAENISLSYETCVSAFSAGHSILLQKENKNLFNQYSFSLEFIKKPPVEVVVPISIKGRLVGFLLFAAKESGDSYNSGDLQVLDTVSAGIAIAIENALLYENTRKFNVKLKSEINKATKRLQKQNEELKKLSSAKDEFIGIVSHQLRTPLTGIRWFTELLLDSSEKKKSGATEAQKLDFLQQISVSNKRMIQLVDDLLNVSHMETDGKFKISKEIFDVKLVIDEVLNENISLINSKKLKIVNEIPAGLKVFADEGKIKQVWNNFISNATKYGLLGTEIKISETEKDDKFVFSVQDHGIGIPDDQKERLFEKFFRANNAILQDPNGNGLGLYIVKEIVKMHGGEIWVDSEENKGSTFFFSLPQKME